MTFLLPGERIDGTPAQCAHLHLLLACFRASPPPMRLPGVTGRPLPELLGTGIIDKDLFGAGYDIMAGRYERLGVRALLPLERVPSSSPGLPAYPDGRRRDRVRRPDRPDSGFAAVGRA
jgi:hypothetical protein